MQLFRHSPAVPLKFMNRPERFRAMCSMMKCPSSNTDWVLVNSE